MDNLTAGANDSTDEVFGNIEAGDARSVGLKVCTRSGHALADLIEDKHTSLVCLCQCVLENLVAQTIDLDIHLAGGETVAGTGGLEVHIAEVVLIAEDVAQDGIFGTFAFGDKTHSDAADGFLDGYTGIHECQTAGANGSHRAGAVRLEDIADYAYGVGEVFRHHVLEGAASQVAVTNLATTYAALCLSFAGSEGREVIVQQEAVSTLYQCLINDLLIAAGTQCYGRERLCLAAGEDAGSVRSGQGAYLAPDGTDVGGLTAIQTLTFVQYGAAHSLFLYIVVVAVHHGGNLVHLDAESLGAGGHIIQTLGLEVLAYLREHRLAVVLVGVGAGSLCVSASVTVVMNSLLQLVVVHLMAVFAFYLLAIFLHHLQLCLALGLDSLVGGADGIQHDAFGHFLHLALYHHDVIQRSGNYQFEVSVLALLEGGVDDELAVDACYAYL